MHSCAAAISILSQIQCSLTILRLMHICCAWQYNQPHSSTVQKGDGRAGPFGCMGKAGPTECNSPP